MKFVHYDEARKATTEAVSRWMKSASGVDKALLVADLLGKLRLVLWSRADSVERARKGLEKQVSENRPWWSGEILLMSEADDVDRNLWEDAWQEAIPVEQSPNLRTLSRHRTRSSWFAKVEEPLWQAPEDGPGVVVFYSFKGGVGRSTTLASFAIQRAQAGERVAVVDFDLDAPGIGRLLAADEQGTVSPWGVVDYLVERPHCAVPLDDYYHRCARVAGKGEILVFPAGTLSEDYPDKLARVDLEEPPREAGSPIVSLLQEIKASLAPQWILLDARTGVSEAAGHLLSGLAHLHVLFGTTSEQSWQGLQAVIDRLGRQKVLMDKPQAEIVLVQSMVPPSAEAALAARNLFADRAREEFTERYYAAAPENARDPSNEMFWDVRDLDSADAPHVPVAITYDQRLADFRDIAEVADLLSQSTEHHDVANRILARFETEAEV